jgi:DNA processing protein
VRPAPADSERIARALLSRVTTPGDMTIATWCGHLPAGQVLASLRAGTRPVPIAEDASQNWVSTIATAQQARVQLAGLPVDGGITAAARAGIRLICPGDSEWPAALDDLGPARPIALWARGHGDLADCCQHAIAIVGSRAATAYGTHVTTQISADLGASGLTIVSGAAYGIDAAAHTAALASGGVTVAVLACGPDIAYPRGHVGLLDTITRNGLVVSEHPPSRRPSRAAFLARNRIIAALGNGGLLVVEAGLRSGALNAAGHADLLNRPVMAVPGPVTSAASAGCHQLIAECGVPLVTSAAEVLVQLLHVAPNEYGQIMRD